MNTDGWYPSLYRSSDLGASWQQVPGSLFTEMQLSDITAGGNVLLAGFYKDDGVCGYDYIQLRSVDFGQTWQSLSAGGTSKHIAGNYWLLWDHDNPSIYFSNDAGATFSTVPRSTCRDQYYFFPPYSLYAYDRYSVGCLQKWDNAVHAWQPIVAPPYLFFNFCQTANGTLLTGMHPLGGVWRTPNEFTPWTEANHGITSSGVYNLVVKPNNHFFLANETGVQRSTDNCQTWEDRSLTVPVFDLHFWGDTLLASGYQKIYYSTDEGKDWYTLFQTDPVFGKIKTSGKDLYSLVDIQGQKKILHSPDRGSTSHLIVPPLPQTGVSMLDFFVFGNQIWALMDSKQVFSSNDAGLNWEESALQGDFNSMFNQNEHFLLSGLETLYSPDGGASWVPSAGLPAGKFVMSVVNDQNNRWYAVVEDLGIFISDDYGANWAFGENPGYPEIKKLYSFGEHLFANRSPSGLWQRQVITSGTHHTDEPTRKVVLSPNPASQVLTVQLPEGRKGVSLLQVFDLYGNLMEQTTLAAGLSSFQLDIISWPSGCYVLKMDDAVERFLKVGDRP